MVIQWFYRYSDLQHEDIAGRVVTPSEISRNRELWPCQHSDVNAGSLVVGRFKVLDLSTKKMQKDQVEDYVNGSEHHFFWRHKVDVKLRKIYE